MISMPAKTIVFGVLLSSLPVITLVASPDAKSSSIYIPLAVGAPLIILGILATMLPKARMHVMHVAVLIGLLGGIAALVPGAMQLIKLAKGEEVPLLRAGMVWSMAILCFLFVGLCVQSFIAARRARKAGETIG